MGKDGSTDSREKNSHQANENQHDSAEQKNINLFSYKENNNYGINKEENRNLIIQNLLPIFKITNIGCFLLVAISIGSDSLLSYMGTTHDKVISSNVIIAIVTATTAQLGAIMYTVAKFYFNSKDS